MKIRHILLFLTVFLGASLLIAVTVQIRSEVLDYQTAQRLVASNAVREQLLLGASGLAEERSRTYMLLIGHGRIAEEGERLATLRQRNDALLETAEREITTSQSDLRGSDGSLASLSHLRRSLGVLREQADARLGASQPAPVADIAPRWFQEATRLIEELQSFRLTILQRERPQDPTLRAEAVIRTYASILSENIARNQALLARALRSAEPANVLDLGTISQNSGRAALAWELIDTQLTSPLTPPVRSIITASHEKYASTLAPLQQGILSSLGSGVRPAISSEEWYNAAERSLSTTAAMQRELLRSSREMLEDQLARARQTVVLWTALLLCGVAAVVASILVVRRRVVEPLEHLSAAMLRLADNDLSTPLPPRKTRDDELSEMSDALRVFKANAIRRHRTQQELQGLHARLRETYQQLRKDLEAAAVIQRTMLPGSSTLGEVQYCGLFRPSSLIAGDTYNVVQRNDGGIGFFHVDVAGHGAAAALVSVACHHTLSQAILTRTQGTRLDEIVAQINEGWPEDLPYFTMILGEIDPHAQKALLVQAGHPSPLFVRNDGTVEPVGDGGFPVGMISSASYETMEIAFTPGDRILVYSDGLVEAESPQGEQFSEERLRKLVQEKASGSTPVLLDNLDQVLRTWRGSETLEDDLSVLMLERLSERTPHHALV